MARGRHIGQLTPGVGGWVVHFDLRMEEGKLTAKNVELTVNSGGPNARSAGRHRGESGPGVGLRVIHLEGSRCLRAISSPCDIELAVDDAASAMVSSNPHRGEIGPTVGHGIVNFARGPSATSGDIDFVIDDPNSGSVVVAVVQYRNLRPSVGDGIVYLSGARYTRKRIKFTGGNGGAVVIVNAREWMNRGPRVRRGVERTHMCLV